MIFQQQELLFHHKLQQHLLLIQEQLHGPVPQLVLIRFVLTLLSLQTQLEQSHSALQLWFQMHVQQLAH